MLKFLSAIARSRVGAKSSSSDLQTQVRKISTNDLIATFNSLRKSGREISAQFDNDSVIFNCNLGAFDYKHRSLVLSNVYFSSSTARQIFPGKILNIFLPLQGRTVKMPCKFVAPLIPNEHSLLQVTMPHAPAFVYSRIQLGIFFNIARAALH